MNDTQARIFWIWLRIAVLSFAAIVLGREATAAFHVIAQWFVAALRVGS